MLALAVAYQVVLWNDIDKALETCYSVTQLKPTCLQLAY